MKQILSLICIQVLLWNSVTYASGTQLKTKNDFFKLINSNPTIYYTHARKTVAKYYFSKEARRYFNGHEKQFLAMAPDIKVLRTSTKITISYKKEQFVIDQFNHIDNTFRVNNQLVQFGAELNIHQVTQNIVKAIQISKSTSFMNFSTLLIDDAHAWIILAGLATIVVGVVIPVLAAEYFAYSFNQDLDEVLTACNKEDIKTPFSKSEVKQLYMDFMDDWGDDEMKNIQKYQCSEFTKKVLDEYSYRKDELDTFCKKGKSILHCIERLKSNEASVVDGGRTVKEETATGPGESYLGGGALPEK